MNGATINSDYVVVQWATLGVASVKIELFEGFGEGKILGDNINTKASTFTWDARAAKASDQSDWRIKVSDTNQASVYAIVRVSVPNGPPKGTVYASRCLCQISYSLTYQSNISLLTSLLARFKHSKFSVLFVPTSARVYHEW